jgi:hypothetical protein
MWEIEISGEISAFQAWNISPDHLGRFYTKIKTAEAVRPKETNHKYWGSFYPLSGAAGQGEKMGLVAPTRFSFIAISEASNWLPSIVLRGDSDQRKRKGHAPCFGSRGTRQTKTLASFACQWHPISPSPTPKHAIGYPLSCCEGIATNGSVRGVSPLP